ncbi:uncharacterized protein [Montipora capricornis]|uniref:uncharacterized protein n=1 Tax=Montipora capricornis TaxID=246305 RepID=UPI0035F1D98C
MMYIRHCVAPAVVSFVATFCGIKICGPAQVQSTAGNIRTTASASFAPKPSPPKPVPFSSPLPVTGPPDEPSETVPSSGPQHPTGSAHSTIDLKPTTSLRPAELLPLFPPLPAEGRRRPADPPPPGSSQPPSGFQPLDSPRPLPGFPPSDHPQPPSGSPFPDRSQPSGSAPPSNGGSQPAGSFNSPREPIAIDIFRPVPQSVIDRLLGVSSFSSNVPLPSGEYIRSFLINSTGWNCTSSIAPIEDLEGTDWVKQIHDFEDEYFRWRNDLKRYSCSNRCGLDERNAFDILMDSSELLRCFCDKFCDEYGDCCFDFNKLCRERVNPRGTPLSQHEICRPVVKQHGPQYAGLAVRSTCPRNWKDEIVRRKCQSGNKSNLFNDWPVFDRDRRITYRNVFCARCNGAVNAAYWKLDAYCSKWFNTTAFNLSDFMLLTHAKCSVKIRESWVQDLKKCIPHFQDCSDIGREKNASYCQSQCLGYAFPVCFMSNSKIIRFRNLQCALCNGLKPSNLMIDCSIPGWDPSPPLTILFDFTSSFESRVTVKDEKMYLERNFKQTWHCASDEVYDPYVGKCKSIVSLHRSQIVTNVSQNVQTVLIDFLSNTFVFRDKQTVSVDFMSNETILSNLNCTFEVFNQSDYEQRPNGTVYIKPHHKIYGRTRYTIRGNILLLCVNFSRNATVVDKQRSTGYLTKTMPTSLQIMTFAGCITSMVSLLLLLATYTLFSELRNLPGRVIINLSISLLLYQGVFLAAMKTSSHEQCQVIAILLHYFVLCSFTWMNAMAYDVHKTLTSSDGGRRSNRQGNHNKRLLRYCFFGWGVPAIAVSIFVICDQILRKGLIGYGEGEAYCFISKPEAVLYSFVAPIALIMLFNAFALVHTVLHIVKTRKRTQKVTNQRHSTGVALICVKMASVMGVTWILGIAANVQALSFLWYPYVVLNSLQGLFIFLSFAASGRSLELYRAKLAILRNRCSSTAAKNTARTKDKIVVTRPEKNQSPDVQDCEETPL